MALKFKPDMLKHSFCDLWASIFTPDNIIFCHFALTWTLVFDLDGLENGTCGKNEFNSSNVDR